MQLGETTELRDFLVIDCGKDEIILGLPWLRDNNPEVNWSTGTVCLCDPEPTRQERTWNQEDVVAEAHTLNVFNKKCQMNKLRQ